MATQLSGKLTYIFAGVAACVLFAACGSSPGGAETEVHMEGVPSFSEAERIMKDRQAYFRDEIYRSYESDFLHTGLLDVIPRFLTKRCVTDHLAPRMAVDDFYIRHILPVIAKEYSDDERDVAAQVRETTHIIMARQTFDALGVMLACDSRNGWDPENQELQSSVIPDLQEIYPQMSLK